MTFWLVPRSRRPVLVAAGAAVLVALLGGLATDVGPWYQALAKPGWNPPDWLFGPAWTVIYALAALAAAEAWRGARDGRCRRTVVLLFVVNSVLNVAWSVVFFALRRPDLALWAVALLWLSVLAIMLRYLRNGSPRVAALMSVYLGWVSFASALNLAVVRLNPVLPRVGLAD